jgi:hypothetical protein
MVNGDAWPAVMHGQRGIGKVARTDFGECAHLKGLSLSLLNCAARGLGARVNLTGVRVVGRW